MSTTIRHCASCGSQTPHRHSHDVEGCRHVHGSERFECAACGKPTFAHSDAAFRFPFCNDAPERVSAFGHAMVRP
jgi:endogenous inhibitor of DNA gyrase (YacG/DUF329 family)